MQKEGNGKRKRKLLYRRRVGVTWLVRYGINRGDTAVIVFDGDVKPGDLGYFYINGYDRLSFVSKGDWQCCRFTGPTKVPPVCLREVHEQKQSGCRGIHEGTPYGRVVSIERDGQPVETSLAFRPFDERASLLLRDRDGAPEKARSKGSNQLFRVGDYARLKGNKHWGPFRVTKVVDMRNTPGWDAAQLVSLDGLLPTPSTHLTLDRKSSENATREQAEKFNVKLSITADGKLRVTPPGEGGAR